MILLVDTHLLIWAATDPIRLSRAATAMLENPEHELMFSTVSMAEVAIKWAKKLPDFRIEPNDFRRMLLDNDYRELALTGEHACRLGSLPPIHRDPFDRLLVAQALAEGAALVTADVQLKDYPGRIIIV